MQIDAFVFLGKFHLDAPFQKKLNPQHMMDLEL